jgi:hypothetical protein
MKNRIAALGIAAVVVTSGGLAVAGSSALAAGGAEKPQGVHTASKTSAKTSGVIKCDGGQNINMKSRIVNSPFTFVETGVNDADQAVPGASLKVKGPKHGTDTLLVTFSAETQILGGDANDWMGFEIHLDGTPINPFTAGSDKVAITGEPSWNGNSLQFCTKVGKGKHDLTAYANLHDSSGSHNLFGWLDDYTYSVVRFD